MWFVVSYSGAWGASDCYRELESVHASKFAAQCALAHVLAARYQHFKNFTTDQFLNGRPHFPAPYPHYNSSNAKRARIVWQTLERVHVSAKVWDALTEEQRAQVDEARGPRLIIKLPFMGFYESWYSGELDSVERSEAENIANESDHETDEKHKPAPLRLDADEVQECFYMGAANYGEMHDAIARQYVAEFDSIVSDALGLPLFLDFETMRSPREYNFETDRIFAYVTPQTIRALWDYLTAHDGADLPTLTRVMQERHTSRSGFHSFYSADRDEWPEEILDWDHNQLETLLLAAIECSGEFKERGDSPLDWKIYESMADGEFFYRVFNDGVDWEKFEAAREEKRDAKREKLSPDELAALEQAPPPRDRNTPDLFEGA